MGIIICRLPQGRTKKYGCPYCGFESDNLDDFAVGMCWSCVYAPEVGSDA